MFYLGLVIRKTFNLKTTYKLLGHVQNNLQNIVDAQTQNLNRRNIIKTF